ncbi:MAG: bifunctional glutamate N-acetyltransferase/amino-acid acetyltransferase ArgJ [Dehalococcoidia bacterium]|nr:bifunctional glutamate N-acetyltransferase/amino-acid acetyltransferase ArgJ [Dehalococcoidia bacterium]
MADAVKVLKDGSVTSAKGFVAGATYAGLKAPKEGQLDLGILLSRQATATAGTFTTNLVKSPSVVLSQRHLAGGRAHGVIANSGCANCCVGEQGLRDAEETTRLAGMHLSLQPQELFICSTGLIGAELPMALIRAAVPKIELSPAGGHDFAKAILTTDKAPKEFAVSFEMDGATAVLGGCVKGAGMIHPQMATMLCFLTTDAAVDPAYLQEVLREVVDGTLNMISVDGDTSTNDTVLLFANSASGSPVIRRDTPHAARFKEVLHRVCAHLAHEIVRDGEGASKVIEVTVDGARSLDEARLAARSVSSSLLVKAAVHGNDPNWGRVMMALGKSGAYLEEAKVALFLNDVCLMEHGMPIPFFREAVVATMRRPTVRFRVQLQVGNAAATAWGCDISAEYVHFNSAYVT